VAARLETAVVDEGGRAERAGIVPAVHEEIAIALVDLVAGRPLDPEHDVAGVAVVAAHEGAETGLLAAAVLRSARLDVDLDALEIVLEDEVHDAADRVGAV